jgi:hypothetical protein
MILLIAVLVGLPAGLCRAWIGKRPYRAFELKAPYLVFLAIIPQYFAFYHPKTRASISDNLASVLLVSSLIILLVFSFFNIKKISFWPILIGFLANFLVIILNGGLMPISLETLHKLIPNTESTWVIGQRLGFGKDILLAPEFTRLWFLTDRFTLPSWIHYQVAFSLGDVFIAVGTIWLLWMLGGKNKNESKEKSNE